jgi:hypothetical protein
VRLARFDSVDLLRAHLHTGRTHQIRVHLASVGHPVVGDDTYGGGGGRRLAALPPSRHFLHAAWLRFRHPMSGVLLDLRSPLPDDLKRSMAALSAMPELATHPDPLDVFGFYRDRRRRLAGASPTERRRRRGRCARVPSSSSPRLLGFPCAGPRSGPLRTPDPRSRGVGRSWRHPRRAGRGRHGAELSVLRAERAVASTSVVLLEYGTRLIGLAVDAVRDVRTSDASTEDGLPPDSPTRVTLLDAVALCAPHLLSSEEMGR